MKQRLTRPLDPLDRAKSEYQREALEMPRRKDPTPPKMHWFKRRSYRGLGVSMVRSCEFDRDDILHIRLGSGSADILPGVINMLFFGVYENTKKFIDRLPEDKV